MGRRARTTRRVASDHRRFTIEVFSEGAKTEVQYLNSWYRRHRDAVIINFDDSAFGHTPLQLVEKAVAAKKKAAREQGRGRGRAPDVYWCVFDVDEHPNIADAVALARDNDVRVAISNPCIELWLLLHYEDHRRWDDRRDVQSALKSFAGITKNLTVEQIESLQERYGTARERAVALERTHKQNATVDKNPGSNLYELVDMIRCPPDATGRLDLHKA